MYWDLLKSQDRFSIFSAICCLVILFAYLLFVIFFTFFRSKDMAILYADKIEKSSLYKLKDIHEEIITRGDSKGWSKDKVQLAKKTYSKSA